MTRPHRAFDGVRAATVIRAVCVRCGREVYVHAPNGAHVQHVTCTDLEVLAIEPEGERHAHARAVP